jgi:hypothetical protein
MGLFRSRRGSTAQASSRQPRHLLISRRLQGLATGHQWAPSVRERLLAIARMVEADPDASTPGAEALFNVVLEVASDRAGRDAFTRLSAEPPALAVDDLTHGFVDQANGALLDEETMMVATRILVALDPARFEIPRFPSAEEALSRYERELKTQQRNHGFASRETGPSDFWQRQIAKQAETIRRSRATWRAAVETAMVVGEPPSGDDYVQREAAATREGEEALELLARRYGHAAGREVRAAAVTADDGCTPWSELVHQAAQVVLGSQFEAERWQSMAAMNRGRGSG